MSLSFLMKEYFDNSSQEFSELIPIKSNVPIIPFKESWEVEKNPNRLVKDFKFESFFYLKSFLDEVLEYQEEIRHHGKITVDHLSVRVEVYTQDVEEITEIDIEYSKSLDLIYNDVQYYESDYEFRNRS